MASVAEWLQLEPSAPLTLEAIAKHAGVERRTVFRYFASKESLMEAFWVWMNERFTAATYPSTAEELIAAPKETFAAFDEQEGIIRASLHSEAGRAMRQRTIQERRRAFAAALEPVTSTASPEVRQRLEAVAHVLYSGAAWEVMRDYAGLSGKQAGEAASWALQILINNHIQQKKQQ